MDDKQGIRDANEWTRVITRVGVRGQLVGIGHALLVLEAQRLQALDVAFAAASIFVHLVAFDLAFAPFHHAVAYLDDAETLPVQYAAACSRMWDFTLRVRLRVKAGVLGYAENKKVRYLDREMADQKRVKMMFAFIR